MAAAVVCLKSKLTSQVRQLNFMLSKCLMNIAQREYAYQCSGIITHAACSRLPYLARAAHIITTLPGRLRLALPWGCAPAALPG